MRSTRLSLFTGLVALVSATTLTTSSSQTTNKNVKAGSTTDGSGNVHLAEWTGPYGGVPAFDKMDLSALKPALEIDMARNLSEIEAIANNPEAPPAEVRAFPTIFPPEMKLGEQCEYFIQKTTAQKRQL